MTAPSVRDVLAAFKGMSFEEMSSAIAAMPQDAVAELEAAADEVVGQKVWYPNPGPQSEAYFSQADELFFGGQAGGGKSNFLCGLALNEHWRVRLFRREREQVEGLIDECVEIMGHETGLARRPPIWRLPSGAQIDFAGIPHEQNKTKFQGRARDLIGFDEITEFTETMYRFVIAWNRSTRPGQRCRVVATGNPPTNDEGLWVISYWAPWLDEEHPNPAKPGELRWFTQIDGRDVECDGPEPIEIEVRGKTRTVHPRSRSFIPSSLEDNPDLMRTDYVSVLEALPEALRIRLREGKFTTTFKDDERQVIPRAWVQAANKRWLDGKRPETPMTAIGADPALGGRDVYVMAPRYAHWFEPLIRVPGKELRGEDGEVKPSLLAANLEGARRDNAQVNFDSIGIGAALLMHLQNNEIPYVSLNAGMGSDAKDRTGNFGFANQRTEWWWRMRERLDPEHGDGAGRPSTLALPPDPRLTSDLTAPRFDLRGGNYVVESKDEIKKRLGRSTDDGDAVVMCAYTGDDRAAQRARGRNGSRSQERQNRGYTAIKRKLRVYK